MYCASEVEGVPMGSAEFERLGVIGHNEEGRNTMHFGNPRTMNRSAGRANLARAAYNAG